MEIVALLVVSSKVSMKAGLIEIFVVDIDAGS